MTKRIKCFFILIRAVNALAHFTFTIDVSKVSNSEGVCKRHKNLNSKDVEVYRACRIYQQIFSLGEKKTENWKFKNAT